MWLVCLLAFSLTTNHHRTFVCYLLSRASERASERCIVWWSSIWVLHFHSGELINYFAFPLSYNTMCSHISSKNKIYTGLCISTWFLEIIFRVLLKVIRVRWLFFFRWLMNGLCCCERWLVLRTWLKKIVVCWEEQFSQTTRNKITLQIIFRNVA